MVSLRDLTRVFGWIGLVSFGGPAAQISLMHQQLVEDRTWLSEQEFLRALSFCMLLPGPEAMQLATYAGWRLRGISGGLIAGLLFVAPGAIVVMVLAFLYMSFGALPLVQEAFMGIKAVVVIVVLQALRKVAGKALRTTSSRVIASLAFVLIYAFTIPFPVLILLSATIGAIALTDVAGPVVRRPSLVRTTSVFAAGAVIWLIPLAAVWFKNDTFLIDIASFFAVLATVTFGGAYAVLAYMTQTVVSDFGWLTTAQMIDALGLAETTPGPLILVTQFVAFLAGAQTGGPALGITAAALSLWMTFVPCFIWIFAGAPYVDWIASRPRLTGALSGITAAVVGVIANLGLWFGLHVVFPTIHVIEFGQYTAVLIPKISQLDPLALCYTALAGVLMFGLRRSMIETFALLALTAFLVAVVT